MTANRLPPALAACRPKAGRRGPAAGSVTLEAAIAVLGLLALLGLAIAAGRIAVAGGAVEEAARDAARQASIARDAPAAEARAVAAARATLGNQGLACVSLRVRVDTSGFAVPVGRPARVGATVTCVADLSKLAVPGMPGRRALTATFTSPLDTYRERQ
jgi:Flp pilus assembly protein TadG